MTKGKLDEIKKFANENLEKYGRSGEAFTVDVVTPEGEEVALVNPWYDRTGRFPLDDIKAVEEWGLENLYNFIREAQSRY